MPYVYTTAGLKVWSRKGIKTPFLRNEDGWVIGIVGPDLSERFGRGYSSALAHAGKYAKSS